MRNFVLKLLLFAAPIVILSIGADFFISRQLRNSKVFAGGESAAWNTIYSGTIRSEILIYGSSRAVVQINPVTLSERLGKSCYNVGIDGHNFWAQYFRHQEILKHNKKPQTIIHSLDVSTLGDRGHHLFSASQFLPFMLGNASIEAFTKNYDEFSIFDFRLPVLRYLGNSAAIFHALKLFFVNQPDQSGRFNGYSGQEIGWREDLAEAKKKMPFYTATLDTACLALFEKYLQECKALNINVIFAYTPEYIEGQRFVKNRADILEIYRELSARYKIPFLDYSTDSISYNRSYFYNSTHLNKRGAELFSKTLAEDLNKIFTEQDQD